MIIKKFDKATIKNCGKKDESMSRSYKYSPCCKDPNAKGMKRFANKKVRRTCFDIPSGSAYKKVFCSYIISDYKFFETFYSYIKWYTKYTYRKQYTYKELYRKWYKEYKMK